MKKILVNLYYSLFLLTPLLMFPKTSELFEFNKTLFIYVIAGIIGFHWLFRTVRERKVTFYRTPFDIFLLLFFGSQLLSTIFSIDRHTSFYGYYGRFNGGLLSLIAYIVLFYGFVSLFRNIDTRKILKLSLLSSFVVILWGLSGKIGYDLTCFVFTGQLNNACWTDQFRPAERMFSTLGQPNWLGAYLAINFFIGLYFYLTSNSVIPDLPAGKAGLIRDPKKYLYSRFLASLKLRRSGRGNDRSRGNDEFVWLAYLILNFVAILFTRSRSALLGLIVGLTYCYMVILFRERKLWKRFIPLVVIILLSVLIFKTGVSQIDNIFQNPKSKIPHFAKAPRGEQISNKDSINNQQLAINNLSSEVTESLDIRKIVWKGAWELGLRYSLFGTGVETFAYAYNFVRPQEHNLTSEWDYIYNKAHNEYLNYLATTGFLGLGTYLLFIGAVSYFIFAQLFKSKERHPALDAGSSKRMDSRFRGNDRLLFVCLAASWITILVTNFFGFSITVTSLFFFLIPALIAIESESIKEYEKEIPILNHSYRFLVPLVGFLFVVYLGWITLYFIADIQYAKGKLFAQIEDFQQSAGYIQGAQRIHHEHLYEDKLSNVLANFLYDPSIQSDKKTLDKVIQVSNALNTKSLMASNQNVQYWKTRSKNNLIYYQITSEGKYLNNSIEAVKIARKLAPTDPRIPYTLSLLYRLQADEAKDEEKTVLTQLSQEELNKAIMLKPNYAEAIELKNKISN